MSAPRVIALWLPDWPIAALRRDEPALPASAPIAVIADGAVVAVSAAGRAAGVSRGLRRREAQSRCPSIVLRPADAERDVRGFEPIVAGLETVVPGVAVLRPGFCVIRAAGPAAYFGAERAAAEALVGRVAELGATAVAGVADGVFTAARAARAAGAGADTGAGASTAARSPGAPPRSRVVIVPPDRSPDFLAGMPIGVLADELQVAGGKAAGGKGGGGKSGGAQGGEALVGLLQRLGIRTLGAFAALPADDVLDRFGVEGLALHRRAAGLDDRAAAVRIPPPEFTVSVDFEPPLELAEQVAFGVRAQAERFIEAFTRARLACTGIRVTATDADGSTSDRVWLHPSAFSPADVADRVRWQLGGASVVRGRAARGSTADAASRLRSGIAQVRLAPESVDPIGAHEPGLWGGGPDERVHRALARLQSMLGHGAVLRPELGGGRDPRERRRGVPWGDRGATTAIAGPWPGRLPSPSPGSVFEHPHPVLVADAAGHDVEVSRRGAVSAEPVRLGFADRGLALTGWAGPWPVLRHDAPDAVPRWRFQMVDEHGCGWLLVREGDGWWAHARYD